MGARMTDVGIDVSGMIPKRDVTQSGAVEHRKMCAQYADLVEVECPRKCGARMARDRCVQRQGEEGCGAGCGWGAAALLAAEWHLRWAKSYGEKRDVIYQQHRAHYLRYHVPELEKKAREEEEEGEERYEFSEGFTTTAPAARGKRKKLSARQRLEKVLKGTGVARLLPVLAGVKQKRYGLRRQGRRQDSVPRLPAPPRTA